jgi:serine/threonine protein kinase
MLTEGQLLTPRYEIVRFLKKGGMGSIYEAIDKLLEARVAIKENRYDDPTMRAAFQREARLMANLQHTSLPRCSDLLTVDDGQFLVMEFIEGEDLSTVMAKARAPLPNEAVRSVAWQLLDVLEYLHTQDPPVLHRDIKTSNIKMKEGRVYLLDLGLAYGCCGEMETLASNEVDWSGRTRRYSSPEQLKFERTTAVSDLYSFGATLYYLLTNVQPLDAGERAASVARGGKDPLEDVGIYNKEADEDISRVIMQALSLDPAERPQSAREMRELMFPEEDALPEKTRGRSFFTARLLFEAVTLAALACALFFVLAPNRQRPLPLCAPTPTPLARDKGSQPSTLAVTSSPIEESAQITDEGVSLRHSGKDEEAWNKFKRALELDPNNRYARFNLYDLLWEASATSAAPDEQTAEIQRQADIILRKVPVCRSARDCVARAWANLVKENLDAAIADADEALTKYDPNFVEALTIRASATVKKSGKQIDEQTTAKALADYDRALSLAPSYAQAYANRAEIHLAIEIASRLRNVAPSSVNHLESARSDLERAIGLSARACFYKRLGDVYLAMRNTDAAQDNYRKATEEDPRYYLAYLKLAEFSFRAGKWDEAEASLLEALSNNSIPPARRERALQRLCAVYNNLNQFDAAEKNCRLALKLAPNDGDAKKELERALAAQGAGG